MRNILAAAPLVFCAAPLAAQQPAVSPAMQARAGELVAIINGQGDIPQSFAPSFLSAIPEADLRALGARLVAQLGHAKSIEGLTGAGPSEATFNILFERGMAVAHMVIAPSGAQQIIGWRITGTQSNAVSNLASLDAVAREIAKLPGQSAFIAADLAAEKPIASLAPDRPIGIGSTFKLVVLAEIVRAVEAGEKRWGDLVPIDGSDLPAGRFKELPVGSQIPLRGLAEAMIEISDNSATDILIRFLGRTRIEAMQAQIGMSRPNEPFLTTLEAFKLKGVHGGEPGRRYLALDSVGRRAMLDGEVAQTPASEIGPLFADGRPVMPDQIEWFASARDLLKVMAWLKDHGRSPAGAEALRIMARNPGPLSDIADRFSYVGYKGGSEPGLISMTVLLHAKEDRWQVISASWVDRDAPVDELRLSSLILRAAQLITAGK